MRTVRANARYTRAIDALADLLSRLRLQHIFVGNVARAAWLGGVVQDGSLDVIVIMNPQQKQQVAMMGSHRGFILDRDEIEQSEELDLVPMTFGDVEGNVRVHVLLASNALYGRMVAAGVDAEFDRVVSDAAEGAPSAEPVSTAVPGLRTARAEDLAILLSIAEEPASARDRQMLIRLPEFDRQAYNQRLVSIGLSELVVAE